MRAARCGVVVGAGPVASHPPQTAELLENTGLQLSPQQVQALHRRTGGWAAGLRLAALGLATSGDHEAFLTQFCGDDRSVADYLVGEILSGLPTDLQDFLRVTSICDPMPAALAAELSGREDAGSVLDRLEHQTAAADPWLCLAGALTHLAAGERSAAQADLRHAQQLWPAHAGVDLPVLRAAAEQFGAGPTDPTAFAIADTDQMPPEPELEALTRLSRGHTHLAHDDRAGARAEWEAALAVVAGRTRRRPRRSTAST